MPDRREVCTQALHRGRFCSLMVEIMTLIRKTEVKNRFFELDD